MFVLQWKRSFFLQLCNKGGPSITVACGGGHASCRRQRKRHSWAMACWQSPERERERVVGQQQNRKKEVLR